MHNWEYKFEKIDNKNFFVLEKEKEKLENIGEEGWELISIIPISNINNEYIYYFKRPINKKYKWRYHNIELLNQIKSIKQQEQHFNNIWGAEGWEIATVLIYITPDQQDCTRYILKQPVE